uniref:uncharacterized protein LOC120346453 n=1 Tax=Styela clava TaxID=7725 RepID=UPI00193AAC6E|nr:uncharacterized protein LOC120346453 [Styela clava]
MPVNRLQFAQLTLLLLALPAQYILTEWYGNRSDSVRARSIQEIIRSLKATAATCKSWIKAVGTYMASGGSFRLDLKKIKKHQKAAKTAPGGESFAKEVFRYEDPSGTGYFSKSITVRSPRPKALKYRVGQVIKHKKYGYRGVIVGWDETCKAPKTWILTMHGNNPAIVKTPHYSILVDKRDRQEIQTTYVAQENIDIVTNIEVQHPSIWDYFDFYDGAQYHMRPAMQELYPLD